MKNNRSSYYGSTENNDCETENAFTKSSHSINKFLILNKEFLSSKLAYFFLGIKTGTLVGFTVIFLRSVGLSPTYAGIAYSFGFAGLVVGNLFWTAVADRMHAHRLVFWIISVFALLFICVQPFITLLFGNLHYEKCPAKISKLAKNASLNFTQDANGFTSDSQIKLFWILSFLNFSAYFFEGSRLSFIDAAITIKINSSIIPVEFGSQRTFNSIGFGIGSLVGSLLVDNLPPMPITCYVGIFIVYAFSFVPAVISGDMVFRSIIIVIKKSEDGNESWRKTTLLDITLFLLSAIVLGLLFGVNKSFTMLYIKELGGPTLIVGLCQLVAALSAILTYFFSTRIIDILRGEWNTVCFCCFVWFVRFIFYIVVKTPWLFITIHFVHGMSMSIFISAVARFVQKKIYRHSFTMFFGVIDGLVNGLGPLIANGLGGYLYESYGPTTLFSSFAILSAIWLCVICTIRTFKQLESLEDLSSN